MNRKKSFIIYLIQAALILGCLFFYGCVNDPGVIKGLSQNKVQVEEIKNVQTQFSQGGIMKSILIAPLMLRYETDSMIIEFPKSLHVNFYDSTGKLQSHLDALYGKYYQSQDKVFLRDSVFVYNVKGDTLWSPDLWWDQNTQKFYTDKSVRIHKSRDRIFGGKGLVADQDLSNINIRQITGLINVADSITH